jgi:hypothetical protein
MEGQPAQGQQSKKIAVTYAGQVESHILSLCVHQRYSSIPFLKSGAVYSRVS